MVVGRFSGENVDLEKLTTVKSVQEAMHKSGKESCQMVGDVVSFECDGRDSTKAIIPSEIIRLIEEMARKNAGSTPKTSPEINDSRHATGSGKERF